MTNAERKAAFEALLRRYAAAVHTSAPNEDHLRREVLSTAFAFMDLHEAAQVSA